MSSSHFVSQPPGFKVKLFPHQLASIYNMEFLESNPIVKENEIKETKIGINADITGYGKTLSMIGLIARDKMSWDLSYPYAFETMSSEAKNRIKTYKIRRFDRLKTTLVLVSNNIVNQWITELKKTDLTYKALTSRRDFDDNLEVSIYDVVIVVPSLYNRLIHYYDTFAWKRFILDEPGFLKIPGMEEIFAGFYWFVTATPDAIYSHYKNRSYKNGFLKDLFATNNDFGKFCEDIIVANDPLFIKKSFSMPVTRHFHYQCFQPMYNVVHSFVSPSIARMIEAGNIEGAISLLGGRKSSNIVDIIRQKKEKELTELESKIEGVIDDDDEEVIEDEEGGETRRREKLLYQRKKHLEDQIKDIDERFETMKRQNCHICCDVLKDPIMEPSCQNIFCGDCLLKWLQCKNSCPLCRERIKPEDLIYITTTSVSKDNVEEEHSLSKKLTKIEKTVELIKSKPDGRFLIYSEQNQTFTPLSNAFYENSIPFVQMKGNIKSREKNLDLFKTGEVPVIFLNSNSDSAGLNLPESTDIILYHQMPDSTENQIIGRANRVGRLTSLSVHHLHIQD